MAANSQTAPSRSSTSPRQSSAEYRTPPSTDLYRQQRDFEIIGRHVPYRKSLSNQTDIEALQDGIELARQLLSSQRGLKFANAVLAEEDDLKVPISQPPPPPIDLNDRKRINEDVLQRQKDYLAGNSFTVVCEKDAIDYGKVRPSEPQIIIVSLESVGRAFAVRHHEKFSHRRSQLFLAVMLAHDLIHSMRMSGVGLLRDTPAQICDRRHACKSSDGYWLGEGGWAHERALLGGALAAITSLPGYTFTPREDFPGMILQLRLERDYDHFEIEQADIDRIVLGLDDWELVLPFQPSKRSGPPVEGRCDWLKLRTIDPITDMAVSSPLPGSPHLATKRPNVNSLSLSTSSTESLISTPSKCSWQRVKAEWRAQQNREMHLQTLSYSVQASLQDESG